jgi:hypothetical protein
MDRYGSSSVRITHLGLVVLAAGVHHLCEALHGNSATLPATTLCQRVVTQNHIMHGQVSSRHFVSLSFLQPHLSRRDTLHETCMFCHALLGEHDASKLLSIHGLERAA